MLTFDRDKHEYRLNGRVVPSVTQILDSFVDLSRIPADVLERKRQIGTAVHAAIDLDCSNDLDEESIAPAWAGYFAGWRKFKAESGFIVESSERQVADKSGAYAGTLDLIGELPKHRALIDTKCTTSLYPTVGPQTAAYAKAAGETRIARYALLLTPDGRYNLEPLTNPNDFAVFNAALVIHYWRKSQ